jgi:phosphopantothenoylcysteine decarboxylase/phosphopantothenate--cysteine ligase
VANLVGQPGSGFDADSNKVLLALRSGEFVPLPIASKLEVAHQILNQILKLSR